MNNSEEIIINRDNYDDIDVINTAYITYVPYREIPDYSDYKDDEKRTIVLRNKETGQLERINYTYCGYVPSMTREGCYLSFWGDVEAEGAHACLVFNFDNHDNCYLITLSFCGGTYPFDKLNEMNKDSKYGADLRF